MKKAKRYMKVELMVFLKKKKIIWGKWAILGPKTAYPYNSGSFLRSFFNILHNERGQEVDESYINGFSEKIVI